MKLPNFSATFYCLTTFLLGLKGEIRNNVLAAEMVSATKSFCHGYRYVGSLFRVDEPVPDDSVNTLQTKQKSC